MEMFAPFAVMCMIPRSMTASRLRICRTTGNARGASRVRKSLMKPDQ